MAITLYGERMWDSPYVYTAYVALKEKGLSFDERGLNLGEKETEKAEYAAKSLNAKVPALDHDGFWISESMAITEYLDEAFAAPKYSRLFPVDPKERARGRQVMLMIRMDFLPFRQERTSEVVFLPPKPVKPLSPEAQKFADKFLRVADAVIPDGKTQLFKDWCIADADLVCCLQRLNKTGYDLPKKLRAYIDAQWPRPSIQAFVTHARPAM